MTGPFQAMRAMICDEYIAAGKPKPEMNWLYSRLVEARLFRASALFALAEVWKLVDDPAYEQKFAGGVRMAIEEIAERINVPVEDVLSFEDANSPADLG